MLNELKSIGATFASRSAPTGVGAGPLQAPDWAQVNRRPSALEGDPRGLLDRVLLQLELLARGPHELLRDLHSAHDDRQQLRIIPALQAYVTAAESLSIG